jgi:hypothetical protein
MSTHPQIAYELAVAHVEDLVENAELMRAAAGRGFSAPLTAIQGALAGLGSLLIAAGERLGGTRTMRTRDLIGAAR